MPDINKALDRFEKAVDISFAGGIPSSLLARQDLEAALVKLTFRQTPLRDILSRIKGEGRAHLWNQRIALGANAQELTTLMFYADGAVPNFSDPRYVQRTAPYKYLGVSANITGPMIASGRSLLDIEAEIAEAKLRQVIQAEEWCDFHGDTAVDARQYDGLDVQLTTNVIDNLGAAFDFTLLMQMVKRLRLQGGQPTHVFCSFGIQNQISILLLGDVRYIAQSGTTVTAGIHANNWQSPVGVLPIVGDYFINPSSPYPFNPQGNSSGPEGNTASTIYVLQIPEIEMIDLLPIGRSELAKVADSVRFFINEYTVMAVKFLRRAVEKLRVKIGYIGETLATKNSETIPTEVYAMSI